MGESGANAVSEFVRGGGTLVCLDGSSNFAITRLNLPVVNVLAGEASGPQVLRFYAPGSIFGVLLGRVERAGSPVTLGVPDSLDIYFENSAAFTVSAPARPPPQWRKSLRASSSPGSARIGVLTTCSFSSTRLAAVRASPTPGVTAYPSRSPATSRTRWTAPLRKTCQCPR